jgi:hypothetical protein
MAKSFTEITESWHTGVVTSVEPDQLPLTASPRARNSVLALVGPERAIIEKRPGLLTMNPTPITGGGAVIGQFEFARLAAGVFTRYDLKVSNTGRIDRMDTSGSLTNVSTTLTAGNYFPDFAVANNLLFLVNGQDRVKYDGTSITNFGIDPPVSAPTIADSGGAGLHAGGNYDAFVTFGNSSTGHESSAGPTSGTVAVAASRTINWSAIPVSADAQVDRRFLYLRRQNTQGNNFYLAATLNDNVTTSTSTSVVETTLTVIGPDQDSNDRPPSGVKFAAVYKSRVFLANEAGDLFWSRPDEPEAFDPDNSEPVNVEDGQAVTGLFSTEEALLIFKTSSIHVLTGDDEQTFQIDVLDPTVGCVSHRTICAAEKQLWWYSNYGPAFMVGVGGPNLIARGKFDPTVSPTTLNFATLSEACAKVDETEQRVYFAVPGIGQVRNTRILPISLRTGALESDEHDPLDVASLGVAADITGAPRIFIGSYNGIIFRTNEGLTDGVPSGDTVVRWTATAASTDTFSTLIKRTTASAAALYTTGAGLIERKVTFLRASDLSLVGTTRPRITSNTATQIVTHVPITGFQTGEVYFILIGGPNFELDLGPSHTGMPFNKKRYQHFYISARSNTTGATVRIELIYNGNVASSRVQEITLTGSGWDSALWDQARWDAAAATVQRFACGRTGLNWKARIINRFPGETLAIVKAGMTGEVWGDYLG